MEITFNNLTSSSNIICLSGVPNILTFTGSSTTNRYAEYEFKFTTISNIDVNKRYNINFGEYNITSTFDEGNIGGTTFWLPQFNSYENQLYSCHTIVRAMRNIPFIAANFNVWLDDDGDGTMSPIVHIKAKKQGKNFNVTVSSDLPSSVYTWSRTVNGNTNDAMLQGKTNKKISRDKVIMLCFGLSLTTDETQQLLKKSGYAPLYVRDTRDSIIVFSIANHVSVINTNIKLSEYGLSPLE